MSVLGIFDATPTAVGGSHPPMIESGFCQKKPNSAPQNRNNGTNILTLEHLFKYWPTLERLFKYWPTLEHLFKYWPTLERLFK